MLFIIGQALEQVGEVVVEDGRYTLKVRGDKTDA